MRELAAAAQEEEAARQEEAARGRAAAARERREVVEAAQTVRLEASKLSEAKVSEFKDRQIGEGHSSESLGRQIEGAWCEIRERGGHQVGFCKKVYKATSKPGCNVTGSFFLALTPIENMHFFRFYI